MVSTYNQLCPVLFGAGAIKHLPEKVREFGGTKVLCIYDKGVEKSGIADKILKVLSSENIETVIFNEVLPDAPINMINEVGKLAQAEKIDIVVGVGGGSTLDTAKAAAILAGNPMPIQQYLLTEGGKYDVVVPLILLPTTSGTGSEVTVMAVLHDEQSHMKNAVHRSANLAIVDPELTLTVPQHVTAMTGCDALSHVVEAFTTNCGNPKSDILSLAVMKLIVENLEKAYLDGSNLEARTNLCLASNLAGMAFNDSSVHVGHAAAHEFGVIFHMAHGVACAITIPEIIRFAADVIPEKTIEIAKALGVELPQGATGVEAGELAAEKVRALMHRIGIKSLKEQGISKQDALACAEGAIMKNPFVATALKPVDIKVMTDLIGDMYDNYQ